MLWPPRATSRATCTHCVGWTSGTAPSRSITGPLGLRTFLMEEIFSKSNLLIRLKPAGQRGGGETWPWHGCRGLMLSRQGAEPIPGESGLRGDPVCRVRGAFLTRYVLILVPNQILVPELRAQLPWKANRHVTAVSPGARGGCTSRVGPCRAPQAQMGFGALPVCPPPRHTEAAGSCGQHGSSKHRSRGSAGSLQTAHQERSSRFGRDGW